MLADKTKECDRTEGQSIAKRVNAEQMLALYVELHAASVREIAAYGALLLVKDTIINAQKAVIVAKDTDAAAATAAAMATEAAAAMAAKDADHRAEVTRLTEELDAFKRGAM